MRKTNLILSGSLIALVAIFAQGYNVSAFRNSLSAIESAIFSWEETAHNFGTVKSGTSVEHSFTFVNKGSVPLIISSVKASCGCTVADYSKEPVEPGQEGFVKATYTASKPGIFTKTVTVTANTSEEQMVLSIKGEVVE